EPPGPCVARICPVAGSVRNVRGTGTMCCLTQWRRHGRGRPRRSAHAKEVTEFHEETIGRAAQGDEMERLRLDEIVAVADEGDGAGNRLIGEERLHGELIRGEGAGTGEDRAAWRMVEDRQVGARIIAQTVLVGRFVLADEPKE